MPGRAGTGEPGRAGDGRCPRAGAAALVAALLAATVLGPGCTATHRMQRALLAPAPPPGTPGAGELAGLAAARSRAVRALRATGKLEVTVDARRGAEVRRNRLRSSQAILVAAPSSFRLEALTPFGVGYAVAANAAEIAALAPAERVLYRGGSDAGTVAAATGVAAAPGDVALLLLGLPPVPALDLGDAWVSAAGGEVGATDDGRRPVAAEILLHATVAGRPDEIVVVGFARVAGAGGPDGLLPVFFERSTTDGALVVRARFGGFRPTAAGPFATRVEIEALGTEAVLTYDDVELNPDLDPSRFTIPTPAGVRELRIEGDGDGRGDRPA